MQIQAGFPLRTLAAAAVAAAVLSPAAPADQVELGTPPPPAWLRGAVAYGVVPPLFGDPPLRSVTRRLDDLKELGIDAIWLSPIQPTDDPSMISYGATDLFGIRPDFGNERDLRRLVREAHARGIKVLLDFTPNHVSSGHPYYQDAVARGRQSPYYDYFDRDENGQATHYFDWENLMNLNYANPAVQEMIAEAFEYWIEEFGVDGFRVDAAWGPRERQPDFWGRLNERLSRLKPDLFMLAEASARDPYYVRNGFDAAYDWGEGMGQWAWSEVFADDEQIGRRLHEALTAGEGTPPAQVARFLNNNDTGERFISRHGLERTRVAATLLLTLPGLPVVYMGDEVGAQFEPYEDPPPISWNDPLQLRPHYARLIELRERCPALAEGDFTPVPLEGSGAAYAYLRETPEGDKALVLLNFGGAGRVRLRSQGLPPGPWRDLLSGTTVHLQDLEVDLEQESSLVLTPGDSDLAAPKF